MNQILVLTFMFILYSCVPGQESDVSIEGQSAIINQVSLKTDFNAKVGDWSLDTDQAEVTLTLKNNSSRPITNLTMDLSNVGEVDGMAFLADRGLSSYPGVGGTCGNRLEPGEDCIVKLSFEPTESGNLRYVTAFKYKNLIGKEEVSLMFTALAGTPASLVFSNDKASYDLGIVEQVDDEPTGKRFPLITTLELENRGELSARNITSSIASSNAEPNAFTVVTNTCPSYLRHKQKCVIQVAYNPLNQDISDPEASYASSLSFQYGKDQNNKPSTLSSIFKALSTKIVGRIEKSGSQSICFKEDDSSPCGPITVGNTAISSFKLINKGYQKAIVKKIVVSFGDLLAYCEVDSGENLLCYEAGKITKYNAGSDLWYLNGGNSSVAYTPPAGVTCTVVEEDVTQHCIQDTLVKTQLTLYQFPFLVQDTELCMTNETEISGKDILNQGSGTCEIGIKFHPPIDFNRAGQVWTGEEIAVLPASGFPSVEISAIYDSLWKDKVDTYVVSSPPLFKAVPSSHAQAILRVTRFSFGAQSFRYVTDPSDAASIADTVVGFNESIFGKDLGRYAMVLDNSISVLGRIIIKNEGNTRAIINGMDVEHNGGFVAIPSKDSNGAKNVDIACAPSPEPFFRTVSHFCPHDPDTGETWLDPQTTCEIRFTFTPVAETNKIHQNLCMFGIPTNDIRYNPACIASPSSCNVITPIDKRHFFISYNDGVTKNDSLANFNSTQTIDFELDASLAASGKLQIGVMNESNVTTMGAKSLNISGTEPRSYKYGHMELMNVGSNSIPYIYLDNNNNLDPNDFSQPEQQGLTFVESNEHPFITSVTNNSNGQPFKDCYFIVQNKPEDTLFGQFADLFPEPTTGGELTDFITQLDNYQGNPGTPVTSLDSGESCILTVRSKSPYLLQNPNAGPDKTFESFSNSPDYQNIGGFLKGFIFPQDDCDGTTEVLTPNQKLGGFNAAELEFYYFDNDTDTSNGAVPDNNQLGNRNYVYDTSDTFDIDSEEAAPFVVYPLLTGTPLNAVLWQPSKTFPLVNDPPFINIPAQNIDEVFYFGGSSPPSSTFYNFDESKTILTNAQANVEADAGVSFDDYDQVLDLGVFPDNASVDYRVVLQLNRVGFGYDFDSVTYTPLYTEGGGAHKISATTSISSANQTFQISPATAATGYHIGELEYTYRTNMKVEASRVANPCNSYAGNSGNNGDHDDFLKMVDIDNAAKFDYVTVTKKILVFTKLYNTADNPHISVFTQDYKVCQNAGTGVISENDPYDTTDDANCAGVPAVAAEFDHPKYKFGMYTSNAGTVDDDTKILEDITGDSLYSKVRVRVQNTGTQPLTFVSVTMGTSSTTTTTASGEPTYSGSTNQYNKFDYGVVNSGAPSNAPALGSCTGTLAAGDSCAMFVALRAGNGLKFDINRWLAIQYKFGAENARYVEKVPLRFKPLEPAKIQIEGFGTPIATINDTSDDVNFIIDDTNISRFRDSDYGNDWEQGTTVDAIRLPMGTISLDQAPTWFQFHLKLTADSGALSAFIRQENFNILTEGGAWNAAGINKVSNVNGNSRISIDYDPVSPIYPGETTCADWHVGDAALNNGQSCIIAINYFIDESFVTANASDNANGHEGTYIDFCNNYPGSNPSSCATDRIFFTFTGDIEYANASTVSTIDVDFVNIAADESGFAYFEWDAVSANSNWSNGVTDYLIKYGATEKYLSVLAGAGNGSVAGRWARMTNLVPGNYYTFEILPIVDSKFSSDTFNVSFTQGTQDIKIHVPDDGLHYLHDQAMLVKVMSSKSNYTDLDDACSETIKVGNASVPMTVMSIANYNTLLGLDFSEISPFKAYWTQDTDFMDLVADPEIECVFPDPTLQQNNAFSDSKMWKMVGDTETAGYRNESSHGDCANNYLWIPEFFTGSSIEGDGICIYSGLSL